MNKKTKQTRTRKKRQDKERDREKARRRPRQSKPAKGKGKRGKGSPTALLIGGQLMSSSAAARDEAPGIDMSSPPREGFRSLTGRSGASGQPAIANDPRRREPSRLQPLTLPPFAEQARDDLQRPLRQGDTSHGLFMCNTVTHSFFLGRRRRAGAICA